MALISPGLEITVIDESQYLPSAVGTVPFVLLATAENKVINNTIALGTTKANAGKLYGISSQRELSAIYGLPTFNQSSIGTPLHGAETNEYGLMAAYSALGLGNRVWVIRADIDLAQLTGTSVRPIGTSPNGTMWFDTASSSFGLFEYNSVSSAFTKVMPSIVSSIDDVSDNVPIDAYGDIGTYAVVVMENSNNVFYKTTDNTWVKLGSPAWADDIPVVNSTTSVINLAVGSTFTINGTVFSLVAGITTIDALVTLINNADITGITAVQTPSGRLAIYASSLAGSTAGDLVTAGDFVTDTQYTIVSIGSGATVSAANMVNGVQYTIASRPVSNVAATNLVSGWSYTIAAAGNTNWVALGAANSNFGTTFVANGTGTGTGSGIATTLTDFTGFGAASNNIGTVFTASGPGKGYGSVYAGATTDFTDIGAADNELGTVFTATGPGTNAGTATEVVPANGTCTIVNGTYTPMQNIGILSSTYYRAAISYGSYTQVPQWNSYDSTPRPSGSVWVKTSTQGSGANLVLKKYNTETTKWNTLAAPLYSSGYEALYKLDSSGGGSGISAGSIFVKYNVLGDGNVSYKFYQLTSAGQTKVIGDAVTGLFTSGDTFTVMASIPGSSTPGTYNCTLAGTNPSAFVAAILAANIPNVTSQVELSGSISITHRSGGIITLTNTTVSRNPITIAGFTTSTAGVSPNIVSGSINLTNWEPVVYTYSATTPYVAPADESLWYYSNAIAVDIMIADSTGWKGYKNVGNDSRGYNLQNTDPIGVIVAASAPILQSDNTALVPGDLWLDSGDLEHYPRLYRRSTTSTWLLIDNTDKESQNGIIFADARWDDGTGVDPINGTYPDVAALQSSNHVDIDAPQYELYPRGTLLFNTRRSSYNVKQFMSNYFNAISFPDSVIPTQKATWISASGLKEDGSPYMGHHAQRQQVVKALKAAVDANVAVREENYNFNLIVCPGYGELIPNLVSLNNDRANTGFIIGDTPMSLVANNTSLTEFNATLTTADPYLGLYYPSALTNDLAGNEIAVPASHMMLRTFLHSDNVSYQWFAPAGTRRGLIDNASAIGYVDYNSGLFVRSGITQQLRDTLYEMNINPITLLTGIGIVAYGQKTRNPTTTSMDRINVSRLVNYLRVVLRGLTNQFLFEPNDKLTRDQAKKVVESIFNDLVAKRGIYDYIVVCDTSNNTPDRIARNELYIDVAIAPMKDVEFIYLPIRLKNPGDIANLTA
jgi:hypothetical protein